MQSALALKTEYIDYFADFVPESGAERFISALFHTNGSKANIIRLTLETAEADGVGELEDKPNTNTYASKDIRAILAHDISSFDAPAQYVTVNSFCGFRRKTEQCFALQAFFIDLDGHDLSKDDLQDEIEKTQGILNDAFNGGELLAPSKITFTGRGYGIFYILDRSIAAKTSKTEKLQKYFTFIYKMLLKAYESVLQNGGSRLEVDNKVVDRARVCRIPDTYNYRAETFCKLYDTPDAYYTLDQIKNGCGLEQYALDPEEYRKSVTRYREWNYKDKAGSKTGEGLHKTKIVDFNEHRINNMLGGRVKAFYRLQEIFNDKGNNKGFREELCFQLYNALVQMKDRNTAKQEVKEFNEKFLKPIPETRLIKHTFAGVDHCEGGYYSFSNGKICLKLGISYEEANAADLLVSHKAEAREAAKEETAKRRKSREDIILACKRDHVELRRVDLLTEINKQLAEQGLNVISIKTLDRILKKHGLGRSGTLAYEDTSEYKREKQRKERLVEAKIKKFPKNAREYCSVPGGDSFAASFPADTAYSYDELFPISDILNSFIGVVAPAGSLKIGETIKRIPYTDEKVSLFTTNVKDMFISQRMMDGLYQFTDGLSNHYRVRMQQGLSLIYRLYHSDLDVNMLFNALDDLCKVLSGGKRFKVRINGRDIPIDVYEQGSADVYKAWLSGIEAKEAEERAEAERKQAEKKAQAEKMKQMQEFFQAMKEKNQTPWEKRFTWLQKHRDMNNDIGCTARTFQFLQINLKDGKGYSDLGFKVGNGRYKGSDIRRMLECITVDDLEHTPRAVTEQLGVSIDEITSVQPLMIVTAMVEYWFKIAKERGNTIEDYECKRPRRISTIARYAKPIDDKVNK